MSKEDQSCGREIQSQRVAFPLQQEKKSAMPLSLVDHILKLTPYSEMAGDLHPWQSALISLAIVFVATIAAETIYRRATRPPFRPAGKLCLVTGGSTGLGKALATSLVASGADVVIVARRQSELSAAVKEMEVCFSVCKSCSILSSYMWTDRPRRRMLRKLWPLSVPTLHLKQILFVSLMKLDLK
jgi:hypothetical protein